MEQIKRIIMEIKKIRKLTNEKYLNLYELDYINKKGHNKKYEMVSRNVHNCIDTLGSRVNGMSICAFMDGKMMLLREFRMAVNREVYNLCAGMLEPNESIIECVTRELYEETGLEVECIIDELPPCFSAVAISDIKTGLVFVKVKGIIEDHTSDNELIKPVFLDKSEMSELIKSADFASRAQLIAYFFSLGLLDQFIKN